MTQIPTIVHIGFGAFHRAHQLVYLQRLLDKTQTPWRYCEISLFSRTSIDRLREQQYRFSILEIDADDENTIPISVIKDSMHPLIEGVEAVVDKLASEEVKIITLTITEKGYGLLPDGESLDLDNEDIQHDLNPANNAKSSLGYLVRCFAKRRSGGLPGLTVLSCDNLQANGEKLRRAVLTFASQYDASLTKWIEENIEFPSSMVDRIVPAMNDDSYKLLNTDGGDDCCGVVCEKFTQWVVEDTFRQGRPEWEKVGVTFTDDVKPYEELKLRFLNGAHSFIAYIGMLGGFKTVDEAVAHPLIQKEVLALMLDEQAPVTHIPKGVEPKEYAQALLHRFKNPALRHATSQIALDGSQKVAQRFMPSIVAHLENETPCLRLVLGISAWIKFILRSFSNSTFTKKMDPLFSEFKRVFEKSGDSVESVEQILALDSVFSSALRESAKFKNDVIKYYKLLSAYPAVDALQLIINESEQS